MRRKLMCLLMLPTFLSFLVFLPISAQALTFTIDKVISGEGFVTGWDFGTVTLTDNNDSVYLEVTLNDVSPFINSGSHLKVIALNYDPDKFDNSDIFTVSFDTILNDEDNVQMDGFPSLFDLRIPNGISGNEVLDSKPHDYTNTISLSGTNLDPSDFNFEAGGVFMAFHIGGLEKNIAGSDSVWAGANPASVPEPTTILLLGSGLLGLVAFGRKKLKKS